MASSLMDSLTGFITPQITDSIASRTNESEGAVRKGLLGGSASMLSAIAGRAGDSGFIERIFGMVTNPANEASMASRLSSLTGGTPGTGIGDLGTRFLSQLFGSQQSSVTDAIGRGAGLKESSAGSILAMAAPLVLGLLGQRTREQNLNPSSFGRMLSDEAPSFQKYLPAGLGSLLGGAPEMAAPAVSARAAAARPSSAGRWVWPLLGALVLGGIFWFFNRDRSERDRTVPDTADRSAQMNRTAPDTTGMGAQTGLGATIQRQLPDGTVISIPQAGVESKLLGSIEDSSWTADSPTWLDFDEPLFDSNESTLKPGAQEKVNNVAAILKAHPNVKVKVAGFTDNVGDDAANKQLSTARANAVMNALVQAGVGREQLSAEGYGEHNPVADNATEEGRAKNRRISLQVVEK